MTRASEASLVERFWKKVEKTDTCWLWTAALSGQARTIPGHRGGGYGQIGHGPVVLYAHRLSYEWHVGPIPEGMKIDHICHVRRCVNPDHLRAVTQGQNNQNHCGPTKRNTSGVRGVSYDKWGRRWKAQVNHEGMLEVRHFASKEEAAEAVIEMRNSLHTYNDYDRGLLS